MGLRPPPSLAYPTHHPFGAFAPGGTDQSLCYVEQGEGEGEGEDGDGYGEGEGGDGYARRYGEGEARAGPSVLQPHPGLPREEPGAPRGWGSRPLAWGWPQGGYGHTVGPAVWDVSPEDAATLPVATRGWAYHAPLAPPPHLVLAAPSPSPDVMCGQGHPTTQPCGQGVTPAPGAQVTGHRHALVGPVQDDGQGCGYTASVAVYSRGTSTMPSTAGEAWALGGHWVSTGSGHSG